MQQMLKINLFWFLFCSKDSTLVEALQRLMALVVEKIRSTGELAADVISKMIDAMMGAAVELMETMRVLHNKNYGILAS